MDLVGEELWGLNKIMCFKSIAQRWAPFLPLPTEPWPGAPAPSNQRVHYTVSQEYSFLLCLFAGGGGGGGGRQPPSRTPFCDIEAV